MDCGTLVRRCREQAGLSQRDLARRAGTSPAAVCNYERGDRVPGALTLVRLIAAAGGTLSFDVRPGADLDVEANGRTLEELLDLVDHLPQRHDPQLDAVPFAQLAERA